MRGKLLLLLAGIAIAAIAACAGYFVLRKETIAHDGYRKALAAVAGAKKLVLLNFTGTDWCTGCIILEKQIFEKPTVRKFSREHLETVVVDFPLGVSADSESEKQNLLLQEKFRVLGFPTLILVDSSGHELARSDGTKFKGPEDFIAWVESVQ